MKLKQNEYWACVDKTGCYMPSIYMTKRQAKMDAAAQKHLIDGKFIVRKVRLVKVRKP